ncbi:MAG: thermonuclease family protein [Nitrospirae bacterium]|nr:thermonuclease family protein [Nitrospirota bacterium]
MQEEREQEYLLKIRKVIEQRGVLSFKYLHPDGQVIRHNAIYPREIFSGEKHTYFKAYCYFTRDIRSFRLDRVQSLRPTMKKEPLTLRSRVIAVVLILLIPTSLFTIWTFTGGDPRGEWVLVTHITDGDTIGVGRGWRYQTVRLIGIDTPETVHPEKPVEFFGPEASEFTKRQLEGKKVHLEFEPSTQYDDYGRLLAYVFLMNGTLINAELIKQGYARVIAPSPFHRYKEFRLYEQGARVAGVGLWAGKDICKEIIGNRRSKIYRLPGDAGCGRIKEENRVYFDTEEEATKAGYRRGKK